jgi:hypothetical protein
VNEEKNDTRERAIQIKTSGAKNDYKLVRTKEAFVQKKAKAALHIVNNLERPSDCKDKFYKARPLLDCIRSRCQQLSVEQNVAIDEQMIPFKGKHSLKQYLPSKPYPWAFKNFVLCGKSGLPYDFIMYQGSSMELITDNLDKLPTIS